MEGQEIALVLFDLDGTLLKLNFNDDKIRKELHDFYISCFGIDKYFKPILQKIGECERTIEKEMGAKAASKATRRAFDILEEGEIKALAGSSLLPYAKEAVEAVRKKRIKTGIVSRNSKKVVKKAIEMHMIGPFDIVVAREDTNETKPSAEPITFALSLLKITHINCLLVGDHPYDILSGKRAGVKTAGVLTGIASKKDLKEAGADYIFDNLREFGIALFGEEL